MPETTLPAGSSNISGLAPWASEYVTNYLGKAKALGDMPYQTYQGPLTAGTSDLQTKAFQGIGSLAMPSANYTPVGGSFTDKGVAQSYMNPYMDQILQPQMQALQRQADIQRQNIGAQAAQTGAFGGARSTIGNAQLNADLMRQQQQTTGQAYQRAFENAQSQYNQEQARKIQEAQYGTDYGMRNLAAQQGVINQMAGLGAQQRDIEQQGITADYNEFLKQQQYPYQQVQFQRDMLSGLPISTIQNQPAQLSGIAQLVTALGGVGGIANALSNPNIKSLLDNLGLGDLFKSNPQP